MVTIQKARNHASGGTAGACGRDNSKTSSGSAAVGGNKLPWNVVESRGSKRGRKAGGQCNPSRVLNSQDHVLPAKEPPSEMNHVSELTTPGYSNPQGKLLPIEDARRVWGTLRSTTTFAVSSVIKRLPLARSMKTPLSTGSTR